MNNNIEKYINRRLKRVLNQLEFCKDYDSEKNTFHGGWEKGYCEGQLRVLEDISDMIEEVREEERNKFAMQQHIQKMMIQSSRSEK